MNQQGKIRVMVTGAGAPGGPGIIRALSADPGIQLVGADANPLASGRALLPDFELLPPASAADFGSSLLNICKRRHIDVLLPLVTRELEVIAGMRSEFGSAGIAAVVSDDGPLKVANNKHLLMLKLEEAGIPVAAFRAVQTPEALEQAVKDFGYPQKPVVIKPSLSNGSRGMRILDARRDRFADFFDQKPGTAITTLEEVLNLLQNHKIPEMLVMEYLPGEEYTVDCLLDRGKPLLILPRRRLAMNNGISVAGIFENHPDIISYTRSVFDAIPLHGPAGLQVRINANGEMRMLEINPRLQGSTTTAMGMGINLPAMAVRQAAGLPFNIPQPRWGLRFARVYEDLFFPPEIDEI